MVLRFFVVRVYIGLVTACLEFRFLGGVELFRT